MMRALNLAVSAALLFCATAPSAANAITILAPVGMQTHRLWFDPVVGVISDFTTLADVEESGSGLALRTPVAMDLHLMQVYSIGDADYSLKINDVEVPWSDLAHGLYSYFNLRNYPLNAGDNQFELQLISGAGSDSTVQFGGPLGSEAVALPASAALLFGALAGLGVFRRRARR